MRQVRTPRYRLPRSCIYMFTELRPPGPNQSVYREDCTQCFDSIVSCSYSAYLKADDLG